VTLSNQGKAIIMQNSHHTKEKAISEFLHLAAYPFWTASLLPAIVGTTLPFWLNPPGFSFKWFEAILFLTATILCHTGFSLLYNCFKDGFTSIWPKNKVFIMGIISLVASILIGLYLNNLLQLNKNVHEYIFIIYGITAIFTAVLYVAPPFSFFKRIGGEVILCVGLGMMPVLGAYLIQAGDITRTVYLASLPIVVSTGLWLWVSELISRTDDERSGYRTMVMLFPYHIAGRILIILLIILLYATVILAVFGRSSLNPLSLTALLTSVIAVKIGAVSWNEYANKKKMFKVRKYTIVLHFAICIIIIVSSLASILR
jgi:1,4-dihydroxy-2-naphthoate octaprenyltransferase